jgi:hypothetical protein
MFLNNCAKFWHLHNGIHQTFALIISHFPRNLGNLVTILLAKWNVYNCDDQKKKEKNMLVMKACNPSVSKTKFEE